MIRRVSIAAKKLLDDAVVKVFGSAVSGDYVASSDLDILVVSRKIPKGAMARAELKVSLEKHARLPLINPVEIHLATPQEAESNPIYREIMMNPTSAA